MKLISLFSLLAFSLFFLGCASSGGTEPAATEEESVSTDTSAGAKTSYDGSTGSGLLMERYKSGQIEGLRK